MNIPEINIIEISAIINHVTGIKISGSFLFLVWFFDFLFIRSIIIPVVPPEITPPIPKIAAKSNRSYDVINM